VVGHLDGEVSEAAKHLVEGVLLELAPAFVLHEPLLVKGLGSGLGCRGLGSRGRVKGLGFRVQVLGVGFRVEGSRISGVRGQGLGFGLGFRVWSDALRQGLGFGVWGVE